MNLIDRAVLAVAPAAGLRRLRARRAASILANYDAATSGRRSKSWKFSATDADGAAVKRARIAYAVRDMVRNAPLAGRGRDVIVNNVVGDGIIPSVEGVNKGAKNAFLDLVRRHMDSTEIDANRRTNFYGLQRLVQASVAESGEALVRIRRRPLSTGFALPFQLEVVEPDLLDDSVDTFETANGNMVHQGIEYDRARRRVAYYLLDDHPGSFGSVKRFRSRRVPAEDVIHVYRQDRPGQMRGVSWFAPVAMTLQDLRDYSDAQLMRQKIAACFAAFRMTPDADPDGTSSSVPTSLAPGAIFDLGPGEDIKFGAPPKVENSEFVRDCAREIAMGLGVTYESFFGDLSQVNYSSARMGRMEMDRNVSSWQWLMLIPQFCEPVGRLFLDAWAMVEPTRDLRKAKVMWTPPARIIVDPAKEIPARRESVLAGFTSWQHEVRQLGYDPETTAAQIAEDNKRFDKLGLTLTSDGRQSATTTAPQE